MDPASSGRRLMGRSNGRAGSAPRGRAGRGPRGPAGTGPPKAGCVVFLLGVLAGYTVMAYALLELVA